MPGRYGECKEPPEALSFQNPLKDDSQDLHDQPQVALWRGHGLYVGANRESPLTHLE